MKCKTFIISPDADEELELAQLIKSHSCFEFISMSSVEFSSFSIRGHSEHILTEWKSISKRVDFIFSMYSPQDKLWEYAISFFIGRDIPIIVYTGNISKYPILSIDVVTGAVTTNNFRRHAYNRGFCVMQSKLDYNCKHLIILAELAMRNGFLMSRQSVYYQ